MPVHEFIIRYREYSKSPSTWDEALFTLGDWPYEDSVPDEKVEDHLENDPKWFSVHFWLRYDSTTSYDQLRILAKDHGRGALREQHRGARIY